MNKIKLFLIENKLLVLLGSVNFIFIYSSVFVKGYEYFIDEFYYIACSENPAFGYVDHPPLAPLVLTLFSFIFGNSIFALRVLPAIASSATIVITGLITKEFTNVKSAQILAAFCILASPVFASFAGFYSMNAFEPLIAVLVFYQVIKMIKENNPRRWIMIGVLFGLALMNKHTAGTYIFLIVVSFLLVPQRMLLFNRWFIFCIIISGIIFLPNFIWQILNGFPTLEFYNNINKFKNVPVSPLQFIKIQALFYSPALVPFWIAGTIYLLFNKELKNYKVFGLMFLIAFILFMALKTSRPDRLAFAYPVIIAAGTVYFTNIISKFKIKWIYGIIYGTLAILFITFIPLVIPYLSYENSERLTKFLGVNTEMEKGKTPRIPQLIADRIGWEEKSDMMAKVFLSFPDDEKKRIMIAGTNYGNAGALELYGKKYNFPPVISSHNNYYLWSRERLKGDILLQLAHKNEYEGLKNLFENVDSTNVFFTNDYCSPHEQDLTVFICRKPKKPVLEILESSKYFY